MIFLEENSFVSYYKFGIYSVLGFIYIYIYWEWEGWFWCRHKCVACYKMFNRRQHLVEHMKISHHSLHQPRCGVCFKHCKSFESVREHLNGIACMPLVWFFFFLSSYDFPPSIHLEQQWWWCQFRTIYSKETASPFSLNEAVLSVFKSLRTPLLSLTIKTSVTSLHLFLL